MFIEMKLRQPGIGVGGMYELGAAIRIRVLCWVKPFNFNQVISHWVRVKNCQSYILCDGFKSCQDISIRLHRSIRIRLS